MVNGTKQWVCQVAAEEVSGRTSSVGIARSVCQCSCNEAVSERERDRQVKRVDSRVKRHQDWQDELKNIVQDGLNMQLD